MPRGKTKVEKVLCTVIGGKTCFGEKGFLGKDICQSTVIQISQARTGLETYRIIENFKIYIYI